MKDVYDSETNVKIICLRGKTIRFLTHNKQNFKNYVLIQYYLKRLRFLFYYFFTSSVFCIHLLLHMKFVLIGTFSANRGLIWVTCYIFILKDCLLFKILWRAPFIFSLANFSATREMAWQISNRSSFKNCYSLSLREQWFIQILKKTRFSHFSVHEGKWQQIHFLPRKKSVTKSLWEMRKALQ